MPTVTVGITQEHLSDVYSDPYITKVGHDHRASAPINHPNVTYLSAWVGDTFAGAFMAIKFSALEIESRFFSESGIISFCLE